MLLTKAVKRNIALFGAMFLLLGFFHIILYAKDFATGFSELFCSVLIIAWGISISKRILDDRIRFLTQGVVVSLLLQNLLQFFRFNLLYGEPTVERYLWYAYYIPMIALPLLFFFIAVTIHRPMDKPLPRLYMLLVAMGFLLALGFLTNDFHFLAKSFPSGIMDDNGEEQSGPLYYIINVFIYGLHAIAFIIVLRKNHRYVTLKYRLIPAVPILVGIIYFLLYPLDIARLFFPARLWNIGEVLCFCVIGTLEGCILTGMIPSNRDYEKLFSAANLPAAIFDEEGKAVYKTVSAQLPFLESENTKVISHNIQGGSIKYTVDVEQLNKLNRQIEEANIKIETRNAFIAEETRIKQEQSELEIKNHLYERITHVVRSQIEQIEGILNASPYLDNGDLARIAVLKAYIKRRSNMEILAREEKLDVIELTSAVAESLDYVRLIGANTVTRTVGNGLLAAHMVVAAYEHMEEIIEACLESLSDMIVIINATEKSLNLRIMLKAENFSYETKDIAQEERNFSRKVSITKENGDIIMALTFIEGEDRT